MRMIATTHNGNVAYSQQVNVNASNRRNGIVKKYRLQFGVNCIETINLFPVIFQRSQ